MISCDIIKPKLRVFQVVSPLDEPPSVTIVSPGEGEEFTDGETLPVTVQTVQGDNPLDRVEVTYNGIVQGITSVNHTFEFTAALGAEVITAVARDTEGNESSDTVSIVVSVLERLDPPVVAAESGEEKVILHLVTPSPGAERYEVQRDDGLGYELQTDDADFPYESELPGSFNDEWPFRVRAHAEGSLPSEWFEVVGETLPDTSQLPAPTGVGMNGLSEAVELFWNEVEGASHYEAEIADNPELNNTTRVTTSSLSQIFSRDGSFNETWYGRVRALDNVGSRATSNWSSVTSDETLPDATPLDSPQNPSATGGDQNILVEYDAVDGATHYRIERAPGEDATFGFSVVDEVTTLSFFDNLAGEFSASYTYRVVAVDHNTGRGDSDPSERVWATTDPAVLPAGAITSPEDDSEWAAHEETQYIDDISVAVEVVEGTFPIDRVEVYYDGDTHELNSPYEVEITPVLGSNVIEASIFDAEGNEAVLDPVNITTFDPTPSPPVIDATGGDQEIVVVLVEPSEHAEYYELGFREDHQSFWWAQWYMPGDFPVTLTNEEVHGVSQFLNDYEETAEVRLRGYFGGDIGSSQDGIRGEWSDVVSDTTDVGDPSLDTPNTTATGLHEAIEVDVQ